MDQTGPDPIDRNRGAPHVRPDRLLRPAGHQDDRTQPVFNLEVADGNSFLVGKLGVLVHDNSLVEATPAPFDAASKAAK